MDKKQIAIWVCLPLFLGAVIALDALLGAMLPAGGMLLMGLIGLALYLLMALRRVIAKRPEVGYLVVSLCVGAFLVLGMRGEPVALWAGRTWPAGVQPWLARSINMAGYILLTTLAVGVMKRFKLTMACAALMPVLLAEVCGSTQAAVTTGLAYLGIGLTVDAMLDRRVLLTRKRALLMILCLLGSGCLPLVLLVVLLPRGKFERPWIGWWFRGMTVLGCCVLAVGGMLLTQGFLALPVQAAAFPAALYQDAAKWFITGCRFAEGTPDMLMLGILALTFFTVVTDHDTATGQKMTWLLRLGVAVIALLSAWGIYASGAAFEPVMLTPIVPLTLIILSPDGIIQRMNKQGWHFVFFALHALLLGALCWTSILL